MRNGKLRGFSKKHKKLTVLIIFILIAAIVIGGFAMKGKESGKTTYSFIRTTTLARGTLEDTINATGTISSAKTSNVTTNLNYTVKTINVSVGDTVKEGDVICTLDTDELNKQIQKEESNLSKAKSSAQSAYNSAKSSYSSAVSSLNGYKSTYNSAKSNLEKAKAPYEKAKNSLKSYQNAYDSALSEYNKAGSKYVSAMSDYNKAVNSFNKGKISKSKLISYANAYMKAIQNYYGNCSKGNYDISGSSTSFASASNKEQNSFSASSASSVTVSKTANELCAAVISQVKTLTGTTLSTPSGSNTLYKLSSKSKALAKAKEICNLSSLESAYSSAKSAYNGTKQTYSQYKSAVSQAKDQLDKAKEELENASTNDTLDDLKSQLEECSLKAEQNGTITALNVTVGSAVSMDSAVATIQDLNRLTVKITIEEADVNNIKTGMTCRVKSDASDTVLNGTLTQIDPVSKDGSFGATVTINEKSNDYRIGMNASVDIIVSSSENVYQVPVDAVGNDGDAKFVYRKTGGSGTDMTFEKVTVTTGESNDYYIEISSDNLNEGDVIRSSADLKEGIETVSNSSKESGNSGGLFSGLFGGNKGGGNMPPNSGNMPERPDFPDKSGSSNNSGGEMSGPPSGFTPGGNNG